MSITLGLQFLSLNGYLYCIRRFLFEMENVSYHIAAGNYDKELLAEVIHSILENETDFSEELKLRMLVAMNNNPIDLEE